MRRGQWVLLVLALLGAALVQTGPGLFSDQGIIPGTADSDAHLLFHAQRTFMARCFRAGEMPFWNPYNLLGHPLYAAGQTGATYPPSWLLYPFSNAGRGLFADLTLHLVLLGVGGAVLARAAGQGTAGVWVTAFALSLSPLLVLRLHAGQVTVVATVAWLPWIAAGLTRLARGDRSGRGLTAVALGLACHAGHIQELYYLLAFGLPAWLAWVVARGERRAIIDGAVSVALGLALGAPQLLATANLAAISGRGATSVEWVNEYASRFTDLPALLGLDMFGDRVTVPYWGRWKVWEPLPAFGFGTVVLAMLAPVVATRRQSIALWALVLVAVALALGLELPFSAWACQLIPGWSRFRDPARILMIGLLPLSILAGRTADALAGGAESADTSSGRGSPPLAAAILAIGAGALLFAGSRSIDAWPEGRAAAAMDALRRSDETFDPVDTAAIAPRARAQVARALRRDAGLAAAVAVACALAWRRRPGRAGLWALLGVLCLEYADAGLPFARTHPPPLLDGDAQSWLEERVAGSRVNLDRALVPALATLVEMESPGGSASLMSRFTEALLAVSQHRNPAGGAGGTIEIIRHDGLARILGVSRAVAGAATGIPPPGLEHRNSPGRLRRLERRDPWPRAWVVRQIRRGSNESAELALLGQEGFDPAAEAILGADAPLTVLQTDLLPGAVSASGKPGDVTGGNFPRGDEVTVLDRHPGHMTLRVGLSAPGLVVIAQSWDPGWQARAGAEPVQVLRADHGLCAVALPGGSTTITLRYRPPGFHPGLALALGAGVILLAWTLRGKGS